MAIRFRLTELLEEAGLTQVELQLRTKLSYATINQIANNRRTGVDFETIDKLCAALGCEPGDLFVRLNEAVPKRKRNQSG